MLIPAFLKSTYKEFDIRIAKRPYVLISTISVILFLIFGYFAKSINYMQNDEWVHYKTVENFLNYDFSLHPYIGSTFYVQGFTAFLFALAFGFRNIPILTLTVSLINFAILFLILKKQIKINTLVSLLISLLFFFNPINFYSSFGFMIEEYVLTYILLGTYAMSNISISTKSEYISKKQFILLNIYLALGFFVKHYIIIIYAGWLLYLFLKSIKRTNANFFFFNRFGINISNIKILLVQIGITILIVGYYTFLFPKTLVMQNQHLDFLAIFAYKKLLMILLYLSCFFVPLNLTFIIKYRRHINIPILIAISISLIFIFYYLDISLKFPYFQNTFTREGFYKADLDGLKYHFKGFYKIFETWQFIGILSLSFLITIFLKKVIHEKVNLVAKINPKSLIFLCLFATYLVFCMFAEPLYDRYLLPLFVFYILFICTMLDNYLLSKFKFIILCFLSFTVSISVLFFLDFIYLENYVWKKSTEIILTNKIDPAEINGTHSWNLYYDDNKVKGAATSAENTNSDISKPIIYKFSFNDPKTVDDPNYKLIDTFENTAVNKIFVNPKIYLYEVKN